MKRVLMASAMFLTMGFAANAQKESDLKPFKVDLSVGYAIPGGDGAKGGALFVVEPKYAIMSNLALGLRIETAVMARGYESSGSSSSTTTDFEVKASGSYLATGDYYFSDNYSFRPFGGIGLGIYSLAAGSTANGGSTSADVSSKFGQMVRLGIESGHFRLGVEYNLVPDTELTYSFGSTTAKTTSKNSYIGIKLGVCLGGGPR